MIDAGASAAAAMAMHVETYGVGPTVVLIHGLGSSARDWELQIPALAALYRVIALDLRGHGRSACEDASSISIAQLAADVAAIIDREHAAPAFVAGISMGGMVALQLAVDRPELVRGIAVINSGPESFSSAVEAHRVEVARRIGVVERDGMRGMGESLASGLFPGDHQRALRDSFRDRWAANDPAMYLASLRALVDWSVRARLRELSLPVIAITGDRDYTPVAYKAGYVAELAHAELVVIADSGHMTTHDQPVALSEALLAFFARNATPVHDPDAALQHSNVAGDL